MNLFKLRISSGLFFVALVISIFCSALFAQSNNESAISKNEKKSVEARANDLVSRMTVEEKLGIIVGDGRFLPTVDPKTV